MLAVELRTAKLIPGFFYQFLVFGNFRAECSQQVAHDGRIDTYIKRLFTASLLSCERPPAKRR